MKGKPPERREHGFGMHNELTEVDIKKMQEEIEYRISLRPQLREEVARTRDFGDLSENDEYRSAKREKNKNDSRIRYLQNMIRTAVIISPKSDADTVGLFDRVRLYAEDEGCEEEFQIVTSLRQDVLSGYISKESPMGQALMGHRVGDRILIEVNPKFSYYVVIREIIKGTDDENIPISSY